MKNLFTALAKFQDEVPVINKGTEGFGYNYTDINDVLTITRPILSENGLSIIQSLNDNCVKTILFHIESGETMESSIEIDPTVKLGSMNQYQAMGSAITYFRRYSLICMLGLAMEDTDASDKKPAPKKEAPTRKRKTEPVKRIPISDDQFEKSKEGTIPQLVVVLNKYELSKEQRELLTAKLAELKKARKESKN